MTDPEYAVTICDDKGLARSPEYLDLRVKLRRVNADGTRTTVWSGTIDQLGSTLYEAEWLCSYAATAKLTNTKTWMEGLAERINTMLKRLNDPAKVRFLVTEFCVENKYNDLVQNGHAT